jgi:hypothetical protein
MLTVPSLGIIGGTDVQSNMSVDASLRGIAIGIDRLIKRFGVDAEIYTVSARRPVPRDLPETKKVS